VKQNILQIAYIVWAVFMVGLLLFWPARAAEDTERTENRTEGEEERTECVIEDSENKYIEMALYASGYFREDVPLDGDTQAFLRAACEETGIPYELALAVIRQETEFRNVTGDDGRSVGYMQVQRRWHEDRMARLGVTDLADPYGNFRVGCDYLAELLGKYPLEEALTAYNSGKPGKSAYASNVLTYMEAYYGD
jgi:soluble lytic murein transglycosylase-like protein